MGVSEGIRAPSSGFYDRYVNRIFTKWFARIAKDIKDRGFSGTILDIGTGPGRLLLEIAKQVSNVELVGIDISEDMVRIAEKNADGEGLRDRVKFKVRSAYRTGFENCSIDLIVSTGVIHHLREPIQAFSEIYRILKRGGEAWMFDGRRDATKAEFEETVRALGMEEDLPLPLWIIEMIWPHLHIGYKTEVYTFGSIARALKQSPFKRYDLRKEGAYIRIVLSKT